MCEKKKSKTKQSSSDSLSSGDMPEQSAKEIQVPYVPFPIAPPQDKKIHPRQEIPPVPEGKEEPDDNPSPPIDLD